MDITTARERLKEIAAEHFKDNTFTHYINYMLAGDFAVEVAMLLDFTLASLSAAERERDELNAKLEEVERHEGIAADTIQRLDHALGRLAPKGTWLCEVLENIWRATTVEEAVEVAAAAAPQGGRYGMTDKELIATANKWLEAHGTFGHNLPEYQGPSAIIKGLRDALTAAESRGREAGLKEAAEAMRKVAAPFGDAIPWQVRLQLREDLEAYILSLTPSLTAEKGEERCEWVACERGQQWLSTSCRTEINGAYMHLGGFNFCPYCGRAITIK